MSERHDSMRTGGTPVEDLVGLGRESMPAAARDRVRHNVLAQAGWGARPAKAHATFVRAAALFTAAVLSTGSVGYAAASSLPGSALYPVKRAMEEARVALTLGDSGKTDALMDMTRARVREIERLVDSNAPNEIVEEAAGRFGEAANRAVQSEETSAAARERAAEIEADVEGAPVRTRERIADEVPATPPDPEPDPPQEQGGTGESPGPGPGDQKQDQRQDSVAPNSDGAGPDGTQPGATAPGAGDDTGSKGSD